MQEKVLLINSMQKLINHIVVSRKNQEEIFASLSKNDFKKIISNLDDQNQRLRKISMLLISQLLHNNTPLKEKFCATMNIPTMAGRIALNTKLCASSSRTKNTVTVDMSKNIKQVYSIIKQPISDKERQCLFWYINFEQKQGQQLQLDYLTSSQPQSVQIHEILDPIDSMVGFLMPDKGQAKKQTVVQGAIMEPRRRSQYEVTTSNRLVNNYFKPSGLRQDGFKAASGLNQSMGVPQGYSTDRDSGYPKTIHSGIKGINTTTYHEPGYSYVNKSVNNPLSPPLNQIKNNTIDGQAQRSKYSGIKIISTASGVKGREANRSFEENPLFHGPNSTKVGFSNGVAGYGKPVVRAERGYETYRQKKTMEKYPGE